MKYSTAIFTILAMGIPAVRSLPAPSSARGFKIPTCGAETCLVDTNGPFDACATNDLACLCSLNQNEVSRYVWTVQPCIDGDAGRTTCTAGARYQYKDVMKTVCAGSQFGNKNVAWSPTTKQ